VADCVFCGIVAGRRPANRLLEDEHTVAFLNIAPATTGHTLVVPGYDPDELQLMWQAAPVPDDRLAALRHRVLRAAGPP
jgi:histidine triad (HIT) family protein